MVSTQRPPIPGAAGRRLVATILRPLHERIHWTKQKPDRGERHFPHGLKIEGVLPEEGELLKTARVDFAEFQAVQGLSQKAGAVCRLVLADGFAPEEHEVRVVPDEVQILVGDIEGARRALYWLEDEMLKRGGPFLAEGVHRRKAIIRSRISRCFFGPINRPPNNRDELLDDVDYYPDEYLNRLAHDGVNVLWITIRLREVVPSELFPNASRDCERRLTKLRQTIERCARYGIRIYVFCIEPDSLPVDSPVFVQHPELKGHVIDFRAAFCTSTKLGRKYLSDACRSLFQGAPGLGGMIVIPVGERFTHCYSIALPESGTTEERCNCPRCSRRKPEDVLYDTLAAMHRGMVAADPRAELIAWPYGQLIMWGQDKTVAAAGRLPKGVILQHNFETGGTVRQLGRERPLWDYWLSVVGGSQAFRKAAKAAQERGNRVSAKLQVGCSHEDATVPFVPVPGLLHAKYSLLSSLGVTAVMQSWYFGNCPSPMTRAAGALSFAPQIESEDAFLNDLALRDWGAAAPQVVRAWKLFRRAYENYPATHLFGYFGPVQDGLVWPLHLIPKNRPLAPTWKLGYPPSGDYLADCLSSDFTLNEVVTLCKKMSRLWQQGARQMEAAIARSQRTSRQMTEWRVAQAIGVQFESAAEILRFYQLREALSRGGRKSISILHDMEELVRREIVRRRAMLELCRAEPTLGFHSEAEGFKITPALLRKGLLSLDRLLTDEFPKVRRMVGIGAPVFPHYTGQGVRNVLEFQKEGGASTTRSRHPLRHVLVQNSAAGGRAIAGTEWKRRTVAECPWEAGFQPGCSAKGLRLTVTVRERVRLAEPADSRLFSVVADIEPCRLHPRIQFSGDSRGNKIALIDDGYLMKEPLAFSWQWEAGVAGWTAQMDIPLKSARLAGHGALFRFNIRLGIFNPRTNERWELSWTRRSPMKPRQAWEDANPATDYAWARLVSKKSL